MYNLDQMNERVPTHKLINEQLEPIFVELYPRDMLLILYENMYHIKQSHVDTDHPEYFSVDSLNFRNVKASEKELIRKYSFKFIRKFEESSFDFQLGYSAYWVILDNSCRFSLLKTEGGESGKDLISSDDLALNDMTKDVESIYLYSRGMGYIERDHPDYEGLIDQASDFQWDILNSKDLDETYDGIWTAKNDAVDYMEEVYDLMNLPKA